MGYAQIPELTANEARKVFSSQRINADEADKLIYIDYDTNKIPLHIYMPKHKDVKSIILYFHGGGYVMNQSAQSSSICKSLSDYTNSCVILVEYSLSPENKFPYAIHECSHIINWITKNKSSFSNCKDAPLFLCGESSGANLAAASILNRGEKDIQGVILICPSLDYCSPYQSKKEYSKGFLLDEDVRKWFAYQYLNNDEDKKNPLVSINLSENLQIFPRTLIINAYFDPLRDEAETLHKKLTESGISSELKEFDTIHGFFSLKIKPYSDLVKDAISIFINHTE